MITTKRLFRFVAAMAAFSVMAGCQSVDGTADNSQPAEPQFAPDLYWAEDYNGPLGFQMGKSAKSGEPRIMLAGAQLYVTGANNFDLFTQSFQSDGNHDKDIIRKTVDILQREQVPVVRISGSPYYADWLYYYTDYKEKYWETLDFLATCCDMAHVLIIPSVYWNTGCLPDYYGETMSAWGDTGSRTYQFMLQYTKELVDCLKGHKCLAAWEFGNEFNLAADIGIAGYEQMSADCINTALKGFAEVCVANDPEGRIVCSGHAAMRNSQYHLYRYKNWTNDAFSQFLKINALMVPEPMTGMSEHVYEEFREFSDLGKMTATSQLEKAKQCAATNGKVYYIGEFTGPHINGIADWKSAMERHYEANLAQRVQLSLVWNYDYDGSTEWSFSADSEWGETTFEMMRRYNALCAGIIPD